MVKASKIRSNLLFDPQRSIFRHAVSVQDVIDVILYPARIQMLVLAKVPWYIHIHVITEAEGDGGLPILWCEVGAEVGWWRQRIWQIRAVWIRAAAAELLFSSYTRHHGLVVRGRLWDEHKLADCQPPLEWAFIFSVYILNVSAYWTRWFISTRQTTAMLAAQWGCIYRHSAALN